MNWLWSFGRYPVKRVAGPMEPTIPGVQFCRAFKYDGIGLQRSIFRAFEAEPHFTLCVAPEWGSQGRHRYEKSHNSRCSTARFSSSQALWLCQAMPFGFYFPWLFRWSSVYVVSINYYFNSILCSGKNKTTKLQANCIWFAEVCNHY